MRTPPKNPSPPALVKETTWEDVYMAAVKKNALALKQVPYKHMTKKICFEAVKRRGAALQYVPHMLQCPEMCLVAVRQSVGNLRYVRD